MKMWSYINDIIYKFWTAFTREATFRWFAIAVVGCMLSTNPGVAGILRSVYIDPHYYGHLINFFHSTGFSLPRATGIWIKTVAKSSLIHREFGKPVLVGDGTKVAKEGRRTPCVKKLRQESQNSSKKSSFHGHMFGALGVVIGSGVNLRCLPIIMTLQDGCKTILAWKKDERSDDSHARRLVGQACQAAEILAEDCFLVMDRAFLSIKALGVLAEEAGGRLIALVTRAKSSCVAWIKETGPNGEKIPGEKVKLWDLFDKMAPHFTTKDRRPTPPSRGSKPPKATRPP
jgi:hypothetical protein